MRRYLVFEKSTTNSLTVCTGSAVMKEQERIAAVKQGTVVIPLTKGLRLGLRHERGISPVMVRGWLGSPGGNALQLQLYRACFNHDGQTVTLPESQLDQLFLEFPVAEEHEAGAALEITRQTGQAGFFRGRLCLSNPHTRVAFWLEHDCTVELELTAGEKSLWKVKDLMPSLNKVVLKELTERNGIHVSKTLSLRASAPVLRTARVIAMPRFRFAHQTPHERHQGYRRTPLIWAKQMLSNTKGILSVLDTILLRPLEGGLLPDGHPWTTGIHPATSRTVWQDNIIFATSRKNDWAGDERHHPDADEVIVHKVGSYLAGMAKKSASTLEHPFGTPSRMPPAVNYIHGTVCFNAGIIIFNDFEEGIFHLSDARFVDEMQRFAADTKREIIIIFRERTYSPKEYAYFAGMIRSVLPWFSNTNGPVRARTQENDGNIFLVDGKVMWGNPAPYAVVNPITGNWIADVYALVNADEQTLNRICRPPIGKGHYFREHYQGSRQHAQRLERLLAIATAKRVRARGDNLFFVSQTDLDKERELTRLSRPLYQTLACRQAEDVVIIGGGPAGLAVAEQLKNRGINGLVLEGSPSVGATWRRMPSNLRLLTRWSQNELPNTPACIRPTEDFVDAVRFARYLENYAAYHQLRVATAASVTSVSALIGSIEVRTASGDTIEAREVINATGYFGHAFTPALQGRETTGIAQLHFADYRSPATVANLTGGTGKRVLIVGKGISAGQALLELHKAGFKVDLSVRSAVSFGASPRASRLFQRILPLLEGAMLLAGRGRGAAKPLKMQGGQSETLIRSGAIGLQGPVRELRQHDILFEDGTAEQYDLVLFCTGYRPLVSHLTGITFDTQTGLPPLNGMESAEVPHMHFLGLDGLRNFRSRYLRGIRADAAVLADAIARRLRS